ncbi:hypothetical protein [Halosolutus gelatinilyticus]|uniref:hypothetical protein n=1 Tax=Halosolutus gelatinilyticus TaxID=2931975 RepID=UPI001FF13EDC|nr:hypothetical protein [Halosolutus gelatinilyticus]
MYRCVCYTCDEEKTLEDFVKAQKLFSDHVESYHEVELFKIDEVNVLTEGNLEQTTSQVEESGAADE